ncbi:unnamed protein product [Symbiodinium necroappetens]|uniref:Uncharacterized protein n=1 Tax=Symbiodinium necroappetens TaxID=1628268 RepID=A0A812KAB3_9DINO|nr:unnamed protein product [Symbiodinium necroappetens]
MDFQLSHVQPSGACRVLLRDPLSPRKEVAEAASALNLLRVWMEQPPVKRARLLEPASMAATPHQYFQDVAVELWKPAKNLDSFDVSRDKLLGELAAGGPLAPELLPRVGTEVAGRMPHQQELESDSMDLEVITDHGAVNRRSPEWTLEAATCPAAGQDRQSKLKRMQMEGAAFLSKQLEEQAFQKAAEKEEQRKRSAPRVRRGRERSDQDAAAAMEEERQQADENAAFLQQQMSQKALLADVLQFATKLAKDHMTQAPLPLVEQSMNKDPPGRYAHFAGEIGTSQAAWCYVQLTGSKGKAVLLTSLTQDAAERAVDQLRSSGFLAEVEAMPSKKEEA